MDSTTRHILDLSRRGLLQGALGLSALAALQPAASRRVLAQPVFSHYPFTLGVASGDPLPDGVVIWTRLAPEPLTPGFGLPRQPIEVAWEVAEEGRFANPVAQGTALARPELGHAVHVEVTGLRPGRPYSYRFRAGREVSQVGRTRTAPAPDAAARMRFVNAGCQHLEHGWFTAWRHIAEEPELDLVFHYGDYIYEYRGRVAGQPGWGGPNPVRTHLGEEIIGLDDYRLRYAQYRLDPDLAAAHAAHPFAVSFDDHEVDNNWAGPHSEEDGSPRFPVAVPPEVFALRRQAAFQAWYESMPVRRTALPRGPEITAYRRLRFGRHVDFAVLDTRSFRDDQPCGDGIKAPCAEVVRPGAQMLGAAQEAWLLDGAARSGATWQVLAQQVPMFMREYASRGISMDKWDAYPAARARLLNGLRERGVANTVVLSGDVHSAWAATVQAEPGGPALATEFTATSITSEGDGSEHRADTPGTLSRNPHIRFFNNRRGYTLHEADGATFTAIFRAVPYVTRKDAPREDRARFVVEAGRPEVTPA